MTTLDNLPTGTSLSEPEPGLSPGVAPASAVGAGTLAGPAPTKVVARGGAVERRIAMLRFVLICGIVFIHVPLSDAVQATLDRPFLFIRAFLCDGIFRVCVPVLSCISGYLLFRASLDLHLGKLVAKKTRTILVPLVVWNLPLVAALYVIESHGMTGHTFAVPAYPFDIWNWLDATLGITYQPANFPLYFLRDIFVVAMLSPLFGMMIRRIPWIGLALVVAVFYFDLDGRLVLRNTMAINFYVGGLAAVRAWNLSRADRAWPVCLAILLAACVVIAAYGITDIRWFTLVAPLIVWPLGSLLDRPAIAERLVPMGGTSFAIFVMHAPILVAFAVLFEHFDRPGLYPAFWLAGPLIAIVTALGARRLMYRAAPRLAALALGSR